MRLLALLVFALPVRAELISGDLKAIAAHADLIEVAWQDHEWAPDLGIPQISKRFEGKSGVRDFIEAIAFDPDEVWSPPPPNPDVISIPKTNCACVGTHLILVKDGEKILARITFHHLSFFRSKQLNRGFDAMLSAESRDWLRNIAFGGLDLETIRQIYRNREKSNQPPQPTVASRRD